MVKTKKDIIAIIAIALLLGVCITLGVTRIGAVKNGIPERRLPEAQKETVIKEVEKYVEVEKKVSSEMLEDGLREMGFLVTGEYYFTGVMNHSTANKFFKGKLTVPFSESSYVASYDGVVSAGIDLSEVRAEMDDASGTVKIHAPKAAVYNVDIDPESFVLYSEKQSIFNPVSIEDYNDSLIELESNGQKNADDKGLLKMAETNAQQLIRGFVCSLVDTQMYSVEIYFD